MSRAKQGSCLRYAQFISLQFFNRGISMQIHMQRRDQNRRTSNLRNDHIWLETAPFET